MPSYLGGTTAARVGSAAIVVGVGVLAGCGPHTTDQAESSTVTPTTPTTPRILDPDDCTPDPSDGKIDRTGTNLAFTHGFVRIAVGPPDATTPAPPAAGPTVTGVSCYEFTKWGPSHPEVPPDSLLFVFKGAGAGGAQIEFLVGELTGRALPPIGNARPLIGPLIGPINAQIGVSAAGSYHQSPVCALTITAMSSTRAAGSFVCPSASLSDADPLDPDDNVPYDSDESSTSTPPPAQPRGPKPPHPDAPPPAPATSTTPSGPPATVSLSGWFDLQP